jgi:signal transduction histidine kinase
VMLPSLIEDLFVTVRPLADEYGSTLSLEMESPPFNVVSDPRRVRQVLLNLLSNAIKFGEGKPIKVTCKQTDDHGVEMRVIDQGVGIAQDDITRIFEEFVQVSESKQPGTGLGLPISRRLAQLLDGSLTVDSTPGEGSTFRLTLPPSIEDGLAIEPALSAATAG